MLSPGVADGSIYCIRNWEKKCAEKSDAYKDNPSNTLLLTIVGLYFAFRMDEAFESVEFRPALQALIWVAFIAAWITYIGFSFHVPHNFFIVAN